jgi:hypothetical protein
MEPSSVGELVKVAGSGPDSDGIVFDVPSRAKVVVAVVQRGRGAVLRTVAATAVTARAEDGPDDRALRLLIRRTPPPAHGASGGRAGPGRGRSDGHSRAAAHRTTGR